MFLASLLLNTRLGKEMMNLKWLMIMLIYANQLYSGVDLLSESMLS
jgi:hypothetical protein